MTPLDQLVHDGLRDSGERLAKSGFDVTHTDQGYVIGSDPGTTTVAAWPRKDGGDEELPDHVVTVETFFDGAPDEMDDQTLAVLNSFAVFGATFRNGKAKIVTVSRIGVYEGFEDAFCELHLPMITASAMMQSQELVRALQHVSEGESDFELLPNSDGPPRCSKKTFRELATMLENLPSFATCGENGVGAEFPWTEGAISAQTGGLTSLVQFHNVTHPCWGNGFAFKLRLPISVPEEEIGGLCRDLNTRDFVNAAGAPMFGAWCWDMPNPSPAFTGFVPNLFYTEQVPDMMASWLAYRHNWARELFREEEETQDGK